jgi:hypothetical protein
LTPDTELEKASNHLHYEFWMFNTTAQAHASGISKEGWITNALLESFVIHVRGLMDFLYNDNPRPDDVVAQDYFNTLEEWKKLRPQQSPVLEHAKQRAGKEVAHLAYERLNVTPETKPWFFLEISKEVSEVMNVFLENVQKEKLGSSWHTKQST